MLEKESINEVIVVEGKNDSKKLKSFFEVETIETHGLGLNKETIELIKEINKKRGVILFLDPDSPGEKIRNRLNSEIPNLKNAFVLKEDAKTKRKVGIEHATYETLKQALDNLVTYTNNIETLSLKEFYELGLNGETDSSEKRMKVSKAFKIGKCNSKQMLKRLNMLKIKKSDIEKIL